MVQKIYLKMHPVSYINTYYDVKDLVNHRMVKNTFYEIKKLLTCASYDTFWEVIVFLNLHLCSVNGCSLVPLRNKLVNKQSNVKYLLKSYH